MAGLIGTGQAYQQQSMEILGQSQQREAERASENEMIKSAERSQKTNLAGLGAGLGLAAGSSAAVSGAAAGTWGGPVGMVAGAALGFLIGDII